ncbi:MAG: TonB-dependent receptor, partial [Desulfobacteraceae bacterium]
RYPTWEKHTYYFLGDSQLAEKLQLKTRIFHDEYYNVLDGYNADFNIVNMHSIYDDHSDGASLVLRSQHFTKNTLSASFYYKKDIHTEKDGEPNLWEYYEADNFSYGLEDDIKFSDVFSGVIGASYDIQEPKYANGNLVRGDETYFNPQAGINWNIKKDTRFHMGVAKKTRFPTLFELYSGQFGRNVQNLNLATEKAVNYETGIEQSLPGDTLIGINFFRSDVEDLIVRVNMPTPPHPANSTQYQNIGEATYQGIEFNFKTGYLKNNTFEMNYTYLDAKDESPNRISDHLPDCAQNKINVTDLYKLNDTFSFFGKLQFNSGRWWLNGSGANAKWYPLDGFWTADTKLIVTLAPEAVLELGVKNMFDEDYSTTYGYPQQGRTYFIGFKGSF